MVVTIPGKNNRVANTDSCDEIVSGDWPQFILAGCIVLCYHYNKYPTGGKKYETER